MTTTTIDKPEIQAATVKNKGGRPKTYTDDVLNDLAESLEDWMEDETHIWFKLWAVENWVPAEDLPRWAKTNERFKRAYARANTIQEARLVNLGLTDRQAGRIVELILKSKYDYRDRVENIDKPPENAIPSDPKAIQEQIKALQAALSAQEQLKVDLGDAGSAVCDG